VRRFSKLDTVEVVSMHFRLKHFCSNMDVYARAFLLVTLTGSFGIAIDIPHPLQVR